MTLEQHLDLSADWAASGESEPLGFGVVWLWWHPAWTKEAGTHPFFIPMMIHDIMSPKALPIVPYLTFDHIQKIDAFFFRQMEVIAKDDLKLRSLRRFFMRLIKLYRFWIWRFRK